jgi:hypothetical protein
VIDKKRTSQPHCCGRISCDFGVFGVMMVGDAGNFTKLNPVWGLNISILWVKLRYRNVSSCNQGAWL